MTMQTEVIKAWSIITSVINNSNLMSDKRNEIEKAASFLRETALKAIPDTGAQTATQLCHKHEQAEIIAHSDGLQLFQSFIPYLLRRQEAARHYMDKPSDECLEYLTAINKTISELLNLF